MKARSLSSRLASTVLLSSLALAFTTGMERLRGDRQDELETIDRSLEQVRQAHSTSLAESLWVVDRERLTLELGAVVHLPYVERAAVVGPGLSPVGVQRPGAASARRWIKDYPLRRTFEGKTETLGTLRVTIGLDPLDRMLRARLVRRLLFEGAAALCVSGLLLLVVRALVTRRLEGMAAHLAAQPDGTLGAPFPVKSADTPDELDGLALAFNATETRRREEVEVQRACVELSRRLLNAPANSPQEIAQLVLDAALALSRSERGYVAEVDAERRVLIGHTLTAMLGQSCLVGEGDRRVEVPARTGGQFPSLWGHSLNTGEPFFANAPATHASRDGSFPSGHGSLGSLLSVPVLSEGRLVGQIELANRPGGYEERDLRAVEQIAGLYAIALQRLRADKERARLEAQLRQAQKMEAIGTLAGGIAHDFNNILSGILGYAGAPALRLPEGTRERSNLEAIAGLGDRARDLVQQILSFSRQREPSRGPVNLQPVVKETLKLLRSSLPATIDIRDSVPPDVGPAMADPTQIHQVVMNLCTNAFHAMRGRGGVLGVRLEAVEVDEALAATVRGLTPGPAVALTVSDTGTGIPPGLVDRIFDPFFTTKAPGEGTGLGLAVVHGIVAAHHGAIAVQTRAGEGSSFTVYLPRLEIPCALEAGPSADPLRGSGRVLFVDDEPALAELGGEMLGWLGYEAVVATSGRDALAAFRRGPGELVAVVTDHTMPGMTGGELTAELLGIRPDLPVILSTDDAEGVGESHARELGARVLLPKPVTLACLGRALRVAMAPPSAERA